MYKIRRKKKIEFAVINGKKSRKKRDSYPKEEK